MEETRETRATRLCRDVFGRRLWLPEIKSANPARRGGAERAAINAPMSGHGRRPDQAPMIALRGWLDRERLSTKLIMQVHDELVLEAPEAELERVKAEISRADERRAKLKSHLSWTWDRDRIGKRRTEAPTKKTPSIVRRRTT